MDPNTTEMIRTAQTELETLNTERARRVAAQRAVLADAEEADREAERLDARRRELLLTAFGAQKDDAAARELAGLPAEIAALRQRGADAREAAALHAPAIAEMAAPIQAAHQQVRDAEFEALYAAHRVRTEALMRRLTLDPSLIAEWVASAQAFERAYVSTFGVDPRMPEPLLQVGRVIAVQAHAVLGQRYGMLSKWWPEQTGDLLAVLEEFAFRPSRQRHAAHPADVVPTVDVAEPAPVPTWN